MVNSKITKKGGKLVVATIQKENNQVENVLGMWLFEEELEMIEYSWNEFYNNPTRYQNTVVVEMIKQFLIKRE